MDPITILTLVSGGIKLAKDLMPVLDGMVQNGEISATQQRELKEQINSLKTNADGQFQGAHWQIEP